MKRKHYYYFELAKGDGYLLYDGENLIELDSPLSIGDEREVKNAVTKLPKDKNGKMPIVTYSELTDVKISSSKIVFDFKRGTTIDFEERNKKKT
jgi:hypothetical protein